MAVYVMCLSQDVFILLKIPKPVLLVWKEHDEIILNHNVVILTENEGPSIIFSSLHKILHIKNINKSDTFKDHIKSHVMKITIFAHGINKSCL